MEQYETNNPNLYPNGTPFLELDVIDRFLKEAIEEVKHDKVVVIVIGGPQSSAKTTEGIHLIDRVNLLTGHPLTDLTDLNNPQYAQGGKNFIKQLPKVQALGRRIIVWDETASDYRRKRAISNLNKTLDDSMAMIRMFGLIVVLVYHDFTDIPKEMIHQKIITCLFQNEDRDRTKDYVVTRAYNYGKMCIIKENLKTSTIPQYAFNIAPNFHLHFKDLSPVRSQQLKLLTFSIKKGLYERAAVSLNGWLTQEDIAIKVNMSKAWVRKTIKKLKIPIADTKHKIAYYEDKYLEKIRNEIKRK